MKNQQLHIRHINQNVCHLSIWMLKWLNIVLPLVRVCQNVFFFIDHKHSGWHKKHTWFFFSSSLTEMSASGSGSSVSPGASSALASARPRHVKSMSASSHPTKSPLPPIEDNAEYKGWEPIYHSAYLLTSVYFKHFSIALLTMDSLTWLQSRFTGFKVWIEIENSILFFIFICYYPNCNLA